MANVPRHGLPGHPAERPPFLKRVGILFLWTALLGTLLYVSLFAYFYYTSGCPSGIGPVLPESVSAFMNAPEVAFGDKDRMNILLLGIDANYTRQGIMYTKDARSDTIMVVSVDRNAEFLNLLTIPRDMRVSMGPDKGTDKINAAHALGGPEMARRVVQDFLGVPIDHYVKLKLKASEQLIDAVGGITIDVEKDMKYDDNWGHLHIDLKKGLQHLDGRSAVGYSRFRHDPEGDRGRMRRQQQVLVALVKELKKPTNILKINQLARIMIENVESDLSYRQLLALANIYKNFDRRRMSLATLSGSDDWSSGYFMIPDENRKRKLVKRLLTPNPELEPQDLAVEIINASKDSRAGAKLRDVLKSKGYEDIILSKDAPQPSPLSALYDRLNNAHACASIEAILGIIHSDNPSERRTEADYVITIGNDFLDRLEELCREASAANAERSRLRESQPVQPLSSPSLLPHSDNETWRPSSTKKPGSPSPVRSPVQSPEITPESEETIFPQESPSPDTGGLERETLPATPTTPAGESSGGAGNEGALTPQGTESPQVNP